MEFEPVTIFRKSLYIRNLGIREVCCSADTSFEITSFGTKSHIKRETQKELLHSNIYYAFIFRIFH